MVCYACIYLLTSKIQTLSHPSGFRRCMKRLHLLSPVFPPRVLCFFQVLHHWTEPQAKREGLLAVAPGSALGDGLFHRIMWIPQKTRHRFQKQAGYNMNVPYNLTIWVPNISFKFSFIGKQVEKGHSHYTLKRFSVKNGRFGCIKKQIPHITKKKT